MSEENHEVNGLLQIVSGMVKDDAKSEIRARSTALAIYLVKNRIQGGDTALRTEMMNLGEYAGNIERALAEHLKE